MSYLELSVAMDPAMRYLIAVTLKSPPPIRVKMGKRHISRMSNAAGQRAIIGKSKSQQLSSRAGSSLNMHIIVSPPRLKVYPSQSKLVTTLAPYRCAIMAYGTVVSKLTIMEKVDSQARMSDSFCWTLSYLQRSS